MERMQRERVTITHMINMYCEREHENEEGRCEQCEKLYEYAMFRLSKCPFGAQKPACQNCTIHCYKPDMKQHVKDVMRKSGPRMMMRHPYLAIMHVGDTFRKAPELKKRTKTKA